METFRGLSALDMSLFATLCLHAVNYCRLRNRAALAGVWIAVLIGCLLKPILEIYLGSALFVSDFEDGVETCPVSHLMGLFLPLSLFTGALVLKKFWSRTGYNRSLRNHKLSGTSIS